MIEGRTPYIITPGYITNNKREILSGNVDTNTYTWSNYDDTAVKNRLSILETDVSNIKITDANFQHRLNLLENHENNWATKDELNVVEGRVTTLETVPVGLSSSQMDEILND